MRYVIIGNSTAGIACIEAIRKNDKKGEIVVISNEKYHTYGRPLISYYLLGKTDENRMKYRPDDFYVKNNCETKFGVEVTNIDHKNKKVKLSDGEEVNYTKLLVATGSSPFIQKMDGLDRVKNKFTFMTLDDAKALDKAIKKKSKVLIIGAGLIGLKCAEGISGKVDDITIVDLADRILPSILDAEGSAMVQKHLEKIGFKFILNDSVDKFTENTATLKSGKKLDFDVVVVAVGVKPNTSLFAETGGKVNKGIVVDKDSKTSIEDIYAAGDCAESYDICAHTNRILALLPNAYLQGEAAGYSMTKNEHSFENAIPMNAIGFLGQHIITAGVYEGKQYKEVTEDSYKVLFYDNDKLNGYILIGDVARAGIYTSLIRNQTPLSEIDFELIKEKPQLMAFTSEKRNEMINK